MDEEKRPVMLRRGRRPDHNFSVVVDGEDFWVDASPEASREASNANILESMQISLRNLEEQRGALIAEIAKAENAFGVFCLSPEKLSDRISKMAEKNRRMRNMLIEILDGNGAMLNGAERIREAILECFS